MTAAVSFAFTVKRRQSPYQERLLFMKASITVSQLHKSFNRSQVNKASVGWKWTARHACSSWNILLLPTATIVAMNLITDENFLMYNFDHCILRPDTQNYLRSPYRMEIAFTTTDVPKCVHTQTHTHIYIYIYTPYYV